MKLKEDLCLFFSVLLASATTVLAADKPNIRCITAEHLGPDLGCFPDSP